MDKKVKFRPIGDRMVIIPVSKKEAVTESGILLPESVQKDPTVGKVVAANTRWQSAVTGEWIEATVKVGDYVVFKNQYPEGITLGSEKYIIASEHELLTIVEEEK